MSSLHSPQLSLAKAVEEQIETRSMELFQDQQNYNDMKAIFKEILFWAISFMGAFMMVVGILNEPSTIAGSFLNILIAILGFTVCYWGSANTKMGRSIIERRG